MALINFIKIFGSHHMRDIQGLRNRKGTDPHLLPTPHIFHFSIKIDFIIFSHKKI